MCSLLKIRSSCLGEKYTLLNGLNYLDHFRLQDLQHSMDHNHAKPAQATTPHHPLSHALPHPLSKNPLYELTGGLFFARNASIFFVCSAIRSDFYRPLLPRKVGCFAGRRKSPAGQKPGSESKIAFSYGIGFYGNWDVSGELIALRKRPERGKGSPCLYIFPNFAQIFE